MIDIPTELALAIAFFAICTLAVVWLIRGAPVIEECHDRFSLDDNSFRRSSGESVINGTPITKSVSDADPLPLPSKEATEPVHFVVFPTIESGSDVDAFNMSDAAWSRPLPR
ncbi:hypothetical protein Poly51_31930 [Rubripirellula tenax]|uniref:Uncharacterized protein n=1 Tax=Rubripirellula tenax TaxID=2528015 RepID=A0A5C6F1K6_9BACT|nr:hypothetical protein [Rubripirellula tenax]TWU54474.1 hypothetical protein Poly51_31930 [Rubripirellula tenax]